MMDMKIIGVVCLALFFVGCASYGTEVKIEQLDLIKEGVTTKAEVIEILGTPMSTTLGFDKKETLLWMYTKASNTAQNFIPVVSLVQTKMTTKTQTVQVIIGVDGIVEKYMTSVSQSEIKSGLITD